MPGWISGEGRDVVGALEPLEHRTLDLLQREHGNLGLDAADLALPVASLQAALPVRLEAVLPAAALEAAVSAAMVAALSAAMVAAVPSPETTAAAAVAVSSVQYWAWIRS